MKLVRFMYRHTPRYGRLSADHIELINGDPFGETELSGVSMNIGKAKLSAPVEPSKIIAVGLNYRDHADELGMKPPAEPLFFLKPPSAVIGPDEAIVYPSVSRHVEYEAELAVVVGKVADHVSPTRAPEHIFGYTCANDVTARDLQKRDGQWTRAKSFDTFCPVGPFVVTDLNPSDLAIKSRVNGVVKQESSTTQMVYDVYKLVSFASQIMTLLPGDIILTGTPPGVGPVNIGDLVEVEIEGIGILRNSVT